MNSDEKIHLKLMNTITVGDCLEELKKLPGNILHCCLASPPYWNLRDYDIEDQVGLESIPEKYVSRTNRVFEDIENSVIQNT